MISLINFNIRNEDTVIGTISGQRAVVTNFRTPRDGSAKRPNMFCHIPKLSVDNSVFEMFSEEFLEFLESKQDEIIKDAIESGKSNIHPEAVSFNALKDWMASSSGSGNRLTKEYLEKWFAETLEPVLATAICTSQNIDVDSASLSQLQLVEKVLADFKANIVKLASGATKFPEKVCTQILKALNLVSEDSVSQGLIKKVNKMMEKKSGDDLLAML